jgi:hypothetical protein
MCHSPRPSTPRSAIKEVEEELDDEPAPTSEKPKSLDSRRSFVGPRWTLRSCYRSVDAIGEMKYPPATVRTATNLGSVPRRSTGSLPLAIPIGRLVSERSDAPAPCPAIVMPSSPSPTSPYPRYRSRPLGSQQPSTSEHGDGKKEGKKRQRATKSNARDRGTMLRRGPHNGGCSSY